MAAEGHQQLRIDGSISKPADRQALVDKFNKDRSIFAMLLTTQVLPHTRIGHSEALSAGRRSWIDTDRS